MRNTCFPRTCNRQRTSRFNSLPRSLRFTCNRLNSFRNRKKKSMRRRDWSSSRNFSNSMLNSRLICGILLPRLVLRPLSRQGEENEPTVIPATCNHNHRQYCRLATSNKRRHFFPAATMATQMLRQCERCRRSRLHYLRVQYSRKSSRRNLRRNCRQCDRRHHHSRLSSTVRKLPSRSPLSQCMSLIEFELFEFRF